MPSDQTWQQIRSVITELDGGCVDDTWRECEGWLIYGQRTNLGLIRLELCRPERLEPQARLAILDRLFRHTSQTRTARLTRGQG
jgi:hypothetical protein